jgi:hypothetical protein
LSLIPNFVNEGQGAKIVVMMVTIATLIGLMFKPNKYFAFLLRFTTLDK